VRDTNDHSDSSFNRVQRVRGPDPFVPVLTPSVALVPLLAFLPVQTAALGPNPRIQIEQHRQVMTGGQMFEEGLVLRGPNVIGHKGFSHQESAAVSAVDTTASGWIYPESGQLPVTPFNRPISAHS
jgi:hypothetical protein